MSYQAIEGVTLRCSAVVPAAKVQAMTERGWFLTGVVQPPPSNASVTAEGHNARALATASEPLFLLTREHDDLETAQRKATDAGSRADAAEKRSSLFADRVVSFENLFSALSSKSLRGDERQAVMDEGAKLVAGRVQS